MKKQDEVWTKVTIERDGKTFEGRCKLDGKLITVRSGYGTKTTQVGGLPPDVLAKQLLGEMVRADRGD